MYSKRRVSGFTLLELLAVITIIGILATLAVVGVTNATRKARDATRNSDMTNVKQALELYSQDNGTYPTTTGLQPISTALTALTTGGYMNVLPTDRRNTGGFVYRYNSDGTNYVLHVDLEDRRTRETITAPADCTASQTDIATKGNGVLQNASNNAACLRLVND